jgi:hypothetical protein
MQSQVTKVKPIQCNYILAGSEFFETLGIEVYAKSNWPF